MATTLKTDVIIPDLFNEAVQGVFAQKKCFLESPLASLGIVTVEGTMPGGPDRINEKIKVPYFGTIGEFEANSTDGASITPKKIAQTSEEATIARDSLAFEATRWSQLAGNNIQGGNPYSEGARQMGEAGRRCMDKRIMDAAVAAGVYSKSYYSATVPAYISYDMVVDAKVDFWGDEQEDIVALAVHSRTHADLLKLKDANGHPLLTTPADGSMQRFVGLPVIVSDRLPTNGSTMTSPMAEVGTTPPDITLSGTPTGPWNLRIEITTGGLSDGTAKYKFSTDGGSTFSAILTVPAGGGAMALTDTAVDSLVGVNGATGVTATFTNGTYNADNRYTSKANLKARSLLLKRRSLAFWYNAKELQLLTDKDILKHSDVAAMHLYYIAHRYRRLSGSTKAGVVALDHNVTGFVG